jgi:hypothetical protein
MAPSQLNNVSILKCYFLFHRYIYFKSVDNFPIALMPPISITKNSLNIKYILRAHYLQDDRMCEFIGFNCIDFYVGL